MKRSLTPLVLFALFASAFTACTNSSRIIATGLEAKLTGIVRATDGKVTATWHVSNPNIVSYNFSRVTSKVYLNGSYVGAIVNEDPIGIAANSEADRTGVITGGDSVAAQVIADAVAHGSATYRVDSQITILVYDDTIEKSSLTASGTVPVTGK